MTTLTRIWIGATCAFAGASLSAPAFAQSASAAANDATLVIVTAERRDQAQGDVIGNVALIDGDEIAAINAQAPNEILNRAPGVSMHRNNGMENLPAIRSPVLNGGQSAGSFLILEDGVPIRAPGFGNVNQLFETSLDFAGRLEIVRGPGSALYGSNAVHGLVHIVTKDGPDGVYEAEIAGDTFGRASGQVLTQLLRRPNASAYLGLSARHEEGWRDQSGLDQQQLLLGGVARAGPWDLNAKLAAQNLSQETAGFIEGPSLYRQRDAARRNPTPEAFRDARLLRARLSAGRDLGETARLSLTAYARDIAGDINISFLPSRALELTRQNALGLQSALYSDPALNIAFIVGADAETGDGSLYEFQSIPTTGSYRQGLHYDYEVAMASVAVFAQARWRFARDWQAIAGVRGETVRYDYDNQAADGDFGRFRRPADREDEFDALTPKLGLIWSPAADQSAWLNLARGARPPQITDLYSLQTTQTPSEQEVEKIDSIELGWRGLLGPARVEAALYHMDKSDTSFRNADGFTVTGAKTRHQGVEAGLDWPLSQTFALKGAVSYARHTYRFSDNSSRAGESIAAGDDVDSAPRWTWNARLAWTPAPAFEAELEWVHMGEYFTNAANTRAYPGHDIVNLRAEWRARDDARLFAAVRNLGDVAYAERADFAFGNDRYFPGEPLGLTLGLRLAR